MPKVDITKIENYANMTADEKLAAIESFEFEVDTTDSERLKAAVSKANSEAAEWKKKHNALLTEEQQKEAARQEAESAIKVELEALRKEKTVTEHKAQYLTLGYDEKLSAETATAFANGDMAKVFANQKVFVENLKKAERAAALASGKEPPAGHNEPPKGDKAKLVEQYNEAEKRYASSKNFNELVLMQSLDAQIRALPKT